MSFIKFLESLTKRLPVISGAPVIATLALAMIVPAIPGGLPAGRQTYDIASAVHILDLAFVLPLLLTAGIMLWRGHVAGSALAGVLLCLKVTLALALLSMNLAFVPRPNPGETALWVTIAVIAAGWLAIGARRMRPSDAPWLRPSIWCTDAELPALDNDADAAGGASGPTAATHPSEPSAATGATRGRQP